MIQSQSQTSPAPAHPPAWLAYRLPAGMRDEAFDERGEVRPHWRVFLQSMKDLGLPQLSRRWHEAQNLIRENGVTYNVYGDPRGMERPWSLDPIPLLIGPEEAQRIEAGLRQRALLLEAILHDLYGPQRCIKEGLLPPELVHANPAFLRPCHGIEPPGGHFLHLYAANLGRNPRGEFWVLGDRAQSPSGTGYALENRIVASRVLPEPFRDCLVNRLAVFFRTMRDTHRSLARHNRDNPRIVLLTPGPYNETYFEHAYLARYLGYTLVEGGDLTVRDNRVYLKVLGGLRQVDVIVRRLDDDFCDPLELRPESFLGVPGLVQAVRSGNVAVANALGSGLAEGNALLAFLPALCKFFLNEELRIPSVATWWCGQPKALAYVLNHLDDLVLKPALPGTRFEPAFPGEMAKGERDDLVARLKAKPNAFIAQEKIVLSTAPTLVENRLEPRHLVLRCYMAAEGDSFAFMPGGLARVSASAGTMVVSMQRGGGSKDAWVLSSGPVNEFSMLQPQGQAVALTRGGGDLPSRAADNLYWLGRYAERAEAIARLLRCILIRLTETAGLADAPELPALLRAAGKQAGVTDAHRHDPEPLLRHLIHGGSNPASLAGVLSDLNKVAGTVRDRISLDMGRVVREISRTEPVSPMPGLGYDPMGATLSDELDALNHKVVTLAAFGGLAMESVTRGDGWRFLDMGRKLERALQMVELARSMLVNVQANEGLGLEAFLEVADSSMTYRRRYQGGVQPAAVLDLLLLDESNPRSLVFQVAMLAEDVGKLPHANLAPGPGPELRLAMESLAALRVADVMELAMADEKGHRAKLEALLAKLAGDLPALSDLITQLYLCHLETSRHLAN